MLPTFLLGPSSRAWRPFTLWVPIPDRPHQPAQLASLRRLFTALFWTWMVLMHEFPGQQGTGEVWGPGALGPGLGGLKQGRAGYFTPTTPLSFSRAPTLLPAGGLAPNFQKMDWRDFPDVSQDVPRRPSVPSPVAHFLGTAASSPCRGAVSGPPGEPQPRPRRTGEPASWVAGHFSSAGPPDHTHPDSSDG